MPREKLRLLGVPDRWTRSTARRAAARFARCHSSLTGYGAQRLDATGWRTLGFGAQLTGRAGFRQLGTPLATVWATYDEPDALGETIAELAATEPGWLAPDDRPWIAAAVESDFALYTVVQRSSEGVRLHCTSSGRSVMVHVSLCQTRFVPGRHLVGRVASVAGLSVIFAAAYVDAFNPREPAQSRTHGREVLTAALRRFADIELSQSPLDPCLLGLRLPDVLALELELRRVEHLLRPACSSEVIADGTGSIQITRTAHGWRIADENSTIERVRADHCHPLDVELVRQCGLVPSSAIPQISGSRNDAMRLCARVAETLATQRAA